MNKKQKLVLGAVAGLLTFSVATTTTFAQDAAQPAPAAAKKHGAWKKHHDEKCKEDCAKGDKNKCKSKDGLKLAGKDKNGCNGKNGCSGKDKKATPETK